MKGNLNQLLDWAERHYTDGRVRLGDTRIPSKTSRIMSELKPWFIDVYTNLEDGSLEEITAEYFLPYYGPGQVTPWENPPLYEQHVPHPKDLVAKVRLATRIQTYGLSRRGRTYFVIEDANHEYPRIVLKPHPQNGLIDKFMDTIVAGTLYLILDAAWTGIKASRNLIYRGKGL